MADTKLPFPGAARSLKSAGRHSLAILLATTALGVVSAHAVDGTWTGASSTEWTDGTNWSSTPAAPDGTATFTNSGPNTVDSNGLVTIGAVRFTVDPNQAYAININDVFIVNGTGVANNSTSVQTFNVGASMIFQGSSSASGGSKEVTYINTSALSFQDSSTAGTAIVTNNSVLEFNNTSTAASANITNNVALNFQDSASAGNATINNTAAGFLTFNSNSTAANANITNNGSLQFTGSSSGGSATITTNNGASTTFTGTSTGFNARFIVNAGGTIDISGVTAPGITAGSIEGAGDIVLGSRILALGTNNLSTQFDGVLSGTGGSIIKAGSGTTTFTGVNTYTGPTTILAGTLALTGNGSVSNSNLVSVNSTFDISGSAIPLNTIKTLGGTSTGIVKLGNNGLIISNGSSDFAGSIQGNGSLQIVAGTQILSGNNTYAGGTTISGGTLQLGSGGTTGSVVGNIVDNGTLAINRSDAVALGIVISGTGAFQQIGSGTTTLTNTNTYIGPTTVTAGTLAISAAGSLTSNVTNNATFNNAGTVTGSVTSTGTANNTGTITNGVTNSGTFNAAGTVNGAIANNAGTFNVTGALTSNNTFTNANGATLAVGAATYTLQGLLTNSGAVTVASGATLNATTGGITNNATGTITVASGGTVKDDLNNAGVITNNGAYVANVASNTGSITNNGVWTGTVSNAGTFSNNAGATVSGLLTSSAGTVANAGTLNGGANINGGIFTGAGTVTNLTVAGGTFAPGNGTPGSSANVSGNLAFQSAAIYLVTLNPATTASTTVGGTATLGGAAVQAAFQPGTYVNKKYTIVTATGGVNGTFNPAVVSNNANLQTSLTYDANNAYLNIQLVFVAPVGPNFPNGLNQNQQSVANALTGFFNANGGIPGAFATLNSGGLTVASGELGTGVIQSSIKADDLFLNLLLDPSIAGRAGGFTAPGSASRFADDEASAYAAKRAATPTERAAYAMATKAPLLAPQPVNRWSVWAATYGGSATTSGSAVVGSQDTTSRVWGVVAGADYKVTPDTLIGFALAGGGTNYSLANALGRGSSDLFQAGVFGRHNFGPAYIAAALGYGWHDVTTNRTVTLAGFDQLQARFRTETFSGRFEGGYRFATPFVGLTPYAAAQAISFNLPAYAEQAVIGTPLFALNYAGQTTTATRTELGLRTDKSFAMQNAVLTLRGRAAWAHDYNPNRAVTALFQALPGATFVVNGARGNPDAALVSAGAEMKWLNGFSLAATFEGEFSSNVTSYAGKGVAKYSW